MITLNRDLKIVPQLTGLSIECLVIGFDGQKLNVLVVEDDSKIHLPIIAVPSKQSFHNTARNFALNYLRSEEVFLQQLHIHDAVAKIDTHRFVLITYLFCMYIDDVSQTPLRMKWIHMNDSGRLLKKEAHKLAMALRCFQDQFIRCPGKLSLIPKKFTILQLRRMYEAIFQKKADIRNFQKKIRSMSMVRRLSEKEKRFSRRGAYLYSFNPDYS